MLSIKLLGSPQVLDDQTPIHISRRKNRAILYYLAANPAPLSREHLLIFFWPDHERSSGQQILRTTLHDLRKVLGTDLLVVDENITLSTEVNIDARKFEAIKSPLMPELTQLASILELYRGDFLENFDLPDSSDFENWQILQAQYYRRLYIQGITHLSQIYSEMGDYLKALSALEKALLIDPLQEDLQRSALRLHYLAGDRTGAIRRYEMLCKLLDDEMGVPPMAETRETYQAIITDSLPMPEVHLPTTIRPLILRGISKSQPDIPFTGRTEELQKLQDLSKGLSNRLILIEGEAGIGKTRLADEYIGQTQAIVLCGAGHELEQGLPYQPIIDALRSLSNHPTWPNLRSSIQMADLWKIETSRLMPGLFPHLVSTMTGEDVTTEARLREGINQLLRAISLQHQVIFYLDDIQWADASTMALLGYLLREPVCPSITFLASSRPAAPRSPLAMLMHTLTRENRLARIPLTRLTAEDILSFSSHFSASASGPLAEWLNRNGEGTPYFLVELIRYAREKGFLTPDGQVEVDALSQSPVVPATIYSIFQSHLSELSDAARRVLDAAVAVGRDFELEVCIRASGLSETAAMDGLDELINSGLVDPLDDKRFTFHHSLIMEVAYREIGEARHRLIHRQVAEAIKNIYHNRIDSVAGLLAWHYGEGYAPNLAAPFAFRAGQQAARLAAWREAIGFYEQALVGEHSPKQMGNIYLALAHACMQVGEPSKAADVYRLAVDLAHGAEQSRQREKARLGLAQAYLVQGRYEEVLSIVQQVLAAHESGFAAEAELIWGTALSLEGVDLKQASEHLQYAEQQLYSMGKPDPTGLSHIKFEQGSLAAQQGDLEKAATLYREALTVSQSDDSALNWRILAQNNLGYHLLLLGDPSAIEYAQAGLKLALEKGVLTQTPYLYSTLGEIALADNDLEMADRHFNEGLRLAEQFSIKERIAGLTANLGLVAVGRGQKDLAIHHLSTALAQSDAIGTRHLSAQVRIWLVPLLPRDEARVHLLEARSIAEAGNRQRLLADISRLEAQFS
jgi:DNA-binding SARP family transcriptional activator/Flp pilus assembly protein TadD